MLPGGIGSFAFAGVAGEGAREYADKAGAGDDCFLAAGDAGELCLPEGGRAGLLLLEVRVGGTALDPEAGGGALGQGEREDAGPTGI